MRVFMTIGAVAGVSAAAAEIWRHQHTTKTATEPNASPPLEGQVSTAQPERNAGPQPHKEPGALASGCSFKKPEEKTESGLRFLMFWTAPLLAVAALAGWLAYHTWHQGFTPNDKMPQSSGGLLFFDAAPSGSSAIAVINATVDPTGFPDTSLLNLTLTFQGASPGLHWFIAASGEYRPTQDTNLAAFCSGGFHAYRAGPATINCRDNQIYDQIYGSRSVQYNSDDHIGLLDGHTIDRITDSLDGYIDGDTTIISGTLVGASSQHPASILSTKVVIPISTPSPSQIGSDKYFIYAPIGIVDQGDIGTGSPLGRVATADRQATFADSSMHTPINYLPITSLDLSIDLGIQASQLSWASPPTTRADQLRWRVKGQGIKTVKFSLHNPFAADRLSRDSLFAGIWLSLAVSALLLLLERFIEWVLRRSRA